MSRLVHFARRSARGARPILIVVALSLAASAQAAPADPRRDCLGEWQSSGFGGRCEDGDPRCDRDPGPGCGFEARYCLNQAASPAYGGRCFAAPIDRLSLRSPSGSSVEQANRQAILDAVAALGGTPAADGLSFTPPFDGSACSETVSLSIPLRGRAGSPVARAQRLTAIASAGRNRDIDHLVLRCLPPVGEPAPPLSTGCTSDLGAAECAAAQGDYGIHGIIPVPSCLCRTQDAGKPCSRDRHCQGLCLAAQRGDKSGTCSAHVAEFGCLLIVDFYPFEPPAAICLD
jgi:hypothetical protein